MFDGFWTSRTPWKLQPISSTHFDLRRFSVG
jgi:hypothetical protein